MLSQKLKNLKASPTLALSAKAKALKAQGHDVISLTVGEPDWPTYLQAKKAGQKAIDENKTTYTPASGILELKQEVVQLAGKQLRMEINPHQVTIGPGAKFIIYSSLNALLNSGDEVIIPAPYWVSYPSMVELAGGSPRIISCLEKENFKLTAKKLKKAIGSKTKALILNSPCNPTGAEYTKEELFEIGLVVKDHNLIVLCDDIYNQLSFGKEGLSPHLLHGNPELFDHCLCINGASKAYAMTGWRIGWAVGPETLIKAMGNFQSQTVGATCSISQWACVAAISECEKQVQESLKALKERKSFFIQELSKIKGLKIFPPQGAFYLWINIQEWFGNSYKKKKLTDSRQVTELLLEEEKLAVVPGIEFGLEKYLRLSFALSKEDLRKGALRLSRFQSLLTL